MRPLQLKLTGINSYREEQIIDFETLTSQGLFGIFGPTGSGKSSILDAMTLALYAKLPRDTKNFINTNEKKANVSFLFSITTDKTRKYLAERSFRYHTGNNASTVRNTTGRLILYEGDTETVLADKPTEVTNECIRLLGLTSEDFMRTVVLPQGQFSEFLRLKNKERRVMLQRIFHLEKYGIELTGKIARARQKQDLLLSTLSGEKKGYEDISSQKLSSLKKEKKENTKQCATLSEQLTVLEKNFEETNEAYLKELNRFNDPNEVGAGNETDTFKQVIEDPAELIKQMQEVQQVLFNYTTDNAEEFSSEISTIEDKQELLKLKKILIAARDCCNLVRTFGDDELKETFAKMELTKLPSLISEVQHHIDNINQKELFASDDTTKLLVNEAMEDITFNFSKISEEELKIVGGKDAVTEKYKKTVRAFTQNIDPDDPEFITLQEAFLLRFKQHGFEPKSVSEIEEQGKELEDILKKLDELQKKNTVLLRKYNGDAKFARVHKRIREENLARKAANKQPIVSEYDMSIMNVLLSIKSDIDQKVYDRNDILKKDAYFERTVMTQIKAGIDKLGIASAREDRVFIQSRITKQYLDQYNQTYSVA